MILVNEAVPDVIEQMNKSQPYFESAFFSMPYCLHTESIRHRTTELSVPKTITMNDAHVRINFCTPFFALDLFPITCDALWTMIRIKKLRGKSSEVVIGPGTV